MRTVLTFLRVAAIALSAVFFLAFLFTFFGGALRLQPISTFTSAVSSLVIPPLKTLPTPITPCNGYCHIDYGVCSIVCGLCDLACAKFIARSAKQTV